jgi:Ca2+-binding RTX toxin-like protein
MTDSRATISISGPGVVHSLHEELFPESLVNNRDFKKTTIIESLSEFKVNNKVFNNATEEDAKSSWAKKSIANGGGYYPPRNLIFELNNDNNTKNAANYIYNKEFLTTKQKYSTKKVSFIDNNNLKIKEELSQYGKEKLNIYLVGHAELQNNSITIGNLTPEELANRLYEITTINDKTIIHYIDIISCNPTGNINDTKNIENFAQILLEKLNHLEMPIDIISVRTGMIKIDSNGNELSKNNYGIFTNANNENKLYVIRKSENEFLSINTNEIEKLLHTEKISRFNKFSNVIKNIISKKTDALGNFTTTIQKLKNSYQISIKEEDILNANSFDQKSSLFNKYYQTKYKTSLSSKIAKYSFKGIEKFTNTANKYNIFMNFINMPQSLSIIQQSFKNGFIVEGTRDASNLIMNNADLSLDLLKYSKSNEFWMQNKNVFHGITKTQIGLNLISSSLEFWQAADLFKAGNLTDDENKKLDIYVNASLTTARAVSSLGTALLLPLSAKAGPIGAAIGYTIMFSQGVYNSVRTAEELRRLGFNENEITMKSILKFFGHYETSEDPAYITKIESNKLINEIIPNILDLKNKDYFENLNRTGKNSLFYFKKLIYPKVDLYIPFTYETRIIACAYGGCGISRTPGNPIPNKSHSCLTNNSYIGNDVNINLKNEILSKHNQSINHYHSFLTKKETNVPSAPNSQYYSQANIQYINQTVTCPSVNSNTPMIEKIDNPSNENIEKLKSIPDSKKANLYLVGFGDQGIHGNMISSIVADQNDINLFNIHPSTYLLHIVGGKKEDVFEFYDVVHSRENEKGFIDGGEGIDTIHLQGIKNRNMIVSLNNEKSNQFPQLRNIENVFGSNQDDTIYGNEYDNVLIGNNGNDTLKGNDGNDTIFPGSGFDKLSGGKDNDTYIILLKDLTNDDISKIRNDYFTVSNEIKILEEKINIISHNLFTLKNNTNNIHTAINAIDSSYYPSMNKLTNAVQSSEQIIQNLKNKYIELKDLSNSILIKINNINSELKDYEFKYTSLHEELLKIKNALQNISNFEDKSKDSLDEIVSFIHKIKQFHNENTLSDEAINYYQRRNNYYVSEGLENNKKNSIYFKKMTLSKFESLIHEKSSNLMNTVNLLKDDIIHLNMNYESIINKSKSIRDGIKIIDNYDESYDSNLENGLDTIMTDIKNLVSKKSNSHLYFGFYENEKFIPAIQVLNYFQSDKNQHLIISDLKGNIYTATNGALYIEHESTSKATAIDTFKVTSDNAITKIDKPIFDNPENILKTKNIIGTLKNDEIHGNHDNNFISGLGGFDKIYGHDGDDTLSAILESHIPNDYSEENILEFVRNLIGYPTSTKLNGGKGFDTYILNFNRDLHSSFEKNFYLDIDNEDQNESMDNLYIDNSNILIQNIIFEKIKENSKSDLQISFQDVLSKKYYYISLKNWFIYSRYRHMQIQIGKQITIPNTLIEQITKTIENTEERFHFNLSIKNTSSREIIFHENSFNEINSNFKFNHLTSFNYIFHVNNPKLAKLKISHLENDLYFQLNYPNSENLIFTVIKDYYPNKVNFENLTIEINNENLIDPKNFKNMVSELDEGSFIEISMTE